MQPGGKGKRRRFIVLAMIGYISLLGIVALWNLPLAASIFGLGFVIWLVATACMYRPDMSRSELIGKYADDRSRFMDIDGMQVHYQIDGHGEPLVLVHGTIGSVDEWSEWTKQLASNYRVIRMDIPGFGLTGPNKENRYTWKEYVSFLDQFVTRLGLEHFHLGGNSLGGHIAWSYAAEYAEKVQSLILVGPSGLPPGPNLWSIDLANLPGMDRMMQKFTPEFFFRFALSQAYGDKKKVTPKLVKRHYELTRRVGNREALVSHFKTVRGEWNLSDLTRITAPTLILWGKEDKIITWDLHTQFESAIPNVTIRPYDQVGHMVIKEIPEQSAKEAARFMALHAIDSRTRRVA